MDRPRNTHRCRRGSEGVWGMVWHPHSPHRCGRWALRCAVKILWVIGKSHDNKIENEKNKWPKKLTYKNLLFSWHFLSTPPPPWFLVGIKARKLKEQQAITVANNPIISSNTDFNIYQNSLYIHKCLILIEQMDVSLLSWQHNLWEQLIWKSFNNFSIKLAAQNILSIGYTHTYKIKKEILN